MVAIPGLQEKGNKTARGPWSAERKLELVLEGMCGRHSVSELCSQANISKACYYQWRNQFIDAGRWGLVHSEADYHALEERIRQLEAENVILRARVRLLQDLCTID